MRPSRRSAANAPILAAATLFLAAAAPALAQGGEPRSEETGLWGCGPGSGVFRAPLESRIVVPLRLLADLARRADPARPDWNRAMGHAVEAQVRHLIGLFQNSEWPAGARLALGAARPEPRILSLRPLPYPWRVTRHPWLERRIPAHAPPSFPDLARALPVAAGEPGLEVSYRTEITWARCEPASTTAAATPPLRTPLPLDPYLIAGQLPETAWRPLRWGRSFAPGATCFSTEQADFGDLAQYWYLWQPGHRGRDAEGHEFACDAGGRVVEPTLDVARGERLAEPALLSEAPARRASPSATGELRASIVFGRMTQPTQPDQIPLIPAALARRLRPGGERLPASVATTRAFWDALMPSGVRPARTDPGLVETLALLRHLDTVVTGTSSVRLLPRPRESSPWIAEVRGRLRLSDRPLRLRVTYAATTPYDPHGQAHLPEMARASREDDWVLYSGHASLGEAFPRRWLAKAEPRPGAQWISLYNCLGFTFFSDPQFTPGSDARDRLLITPGTREGGARLTLSSLRLWDRWLAGDLLDPGKQLAHGLGPRGYVAARRLR